MKSVSLGAAMLLVLKNIGIDGIDVIYPGSKGLVSCSLFSNEERNRAEIAVWFLDEKDPDWIKVWVRQGGTDGSSSVLQYWTEGVKQEVSLSRLTEKVDREGWGGALA